MNAMSRRGVVRLLLATVGIPIVVGAIGASLIVSWRDELPARIATHWDWSWTVDRVGSVTTIVWLTAAVGAVFAVLGLILVLLTQFDLVAGRVVAGAMAGPSAWVTMLAIVFTEAQRGIDDPLDAGRPAFGLLVLAFLVGDVVAAAAVRLVPRDGRPAAAPEAASPLALGASERAVWTRPVAAGGPLVTVVVVGIGVTVVGAVITRYWWLVGLAVVLTALAVAAFSVNVTVDRHGLTVRGHLGWPRLQVPLDQIKTVAVTEVRPIRDFGGYGYRIAAFGPFSGAIGFVLRGGDAMVVAQAEGRRIVVAVDDAKTAAGLLTALLERDRSQ